MVVRACGVAETGEAEKIENASASLAIQVPAPTEPHGARFAIGEENSRASVDPSAVAEAGRVASLGVAAPAAPNADSGPAEKHSQRAQAEGGVPSRVAAPPTDFPLSESSPRIDKTLPGDAAESGIPESTGSDAEISAVEKGSLWMPRGGFLEAPDPGRLTASAASLRRELENGRMEIVHAGPRLADAAPHGSPALLLRDVAQPTLIESAALLRPSGPLPPVADQPSGEGRARQSFPASSSRAELSSRLSAVSEDLPDGKGLSRISSEAGEATEAPLVASLTHSAHSREDGMKLSSLPAKIADPAAGTADAKPPTNVKTKDKLGVAGEERYLPDFEPQLASDGLSRRERDEFHTAFDLGSPAIATLMLGARDVERSLPVSAMPVANGFHTPSEHVLLQISRHATEFQQFNATSMAVVLKPDADTALFLHLKMQDGQVQVFARFERGNYDELQSHWGRIQQSLQSQGIVLAPLENGIVSQEVSWSGSGSERNPRRGDRPPQREEELQRMERPARPASPRRARSSKNWESWA